MYIQNTLVETQERKYLTCTVFHSYRLIKKTAENLKRTSFFLIQMLHLTNGWNVFLSKLLVLTAVFRELA